MIYQSVAYIILVAFLHSPMFQCNRIQFYSDQEKALRIWSTSLMAEYSSSANYLAVIFPSAPHYDSIGTYEIILSPPRMSLERSIGPLNVSWTSVKQFDAAGRDVFTLLRIPIPTGFRNLVNSYKIHLLPLMYKNNTDIDSLARTSKLEPPCHVTFSSRATRPISMPGWEPINCTERWNRRPASLNAALAQLRLKLSQDGCCLTRMDEKKDEKALLLTNEPLSPSLRAPVTVAFAATAVGSLLISLVAVATVRARRAIRQPRYALAPSGEPYSLLAAHCRSVHTKEPLMQQGMAFRIYLRPWTLEEVCKAVLGKLYVRCF